MSRVLVVALTLSGCGILKDEPEGNPPPVGGSNGGASGLDGTAGSTTGASSGGASSTAGSSSGGLDSTGPAPLDLGQGILLVGSIEQGIGSWTLPMDCKIRFFLPDQLDTQTGVATDWEADVPITIEDFPQSFMLDVSDFSQNVMVGTEGYVGIRCDLEGDGTLDNVGAFYPDLPPELVMVPVDGIELDIVFL